MTTILDQREGKDWVAYHGDAIDVFANLPVNSIGFSVYSPPFASLYTYTNSDRDIGNCRTHAEFYEHFMYIVRHLLSATKPGRLTSFHCMNLPTSKTRDGHIGIIDFRGNLIRLYEAAGWIYHSEVTIWKDPVTAMQRTKALGLLHKTIRKDSAMSRQGIPDYLVTMRKPGDNSEPIAHTSEEFPIPLWQRYASPVWVTTGTETDPGFLDCYPDINPNETLQYRSAREQHDERHICPLQLEVIRRAVRLWSNPGDVVASPFGGIGSEGYVALEEGRKALLCELKKSYFDQLCRNLATVEPEAKNKQVKLDL